MLVHEAYIWLVGSDNYPWENRGHFFAAAAEAMRRILVENARRKQSLRGGGASHRVPLDHVKPDVGEWSEDMLALNEVLERLEEVDKTKAELVLDQAFAGLTPALGFTKSLVRPARMVRLS